MLEGLPLPVRLENSDDIEGAMVPFIRFQQYVLS
jgi:hypothetical protein